MAVHSSRIIQAAREILKFHGYFVDNLWHVDDVHFLCEQQGLPSLSNSQAMEVFEVANDQFDGENGISWPQLERALKIYCKRKNQIEALESQELASSEDVD